MQNTIYAADDELNIRNLIKLFLENAGFTVEVFENGEALLKRFGEKPSDLVILDIMMPGRDGFEICTEIRKISTAPIIMLTARTGETDYIAGLTLGSDDYFTKPFSPMSLVTRVKAIFRRMEMDGVQREKGTPPLFHDLTVDRALKTILFNDKPLDFTPTEYEMVAFLVENSGRAVGRSELLNKVWGYGSEVETRATDDAVKRIRKKLTACGSETLIETVWGFGFKLSIKSGN